MRYLRSSTPKMRLRPGPSWGAYSAPTDPLARGEGLSATFQKNPSLLSAFSLNFFVLKPPKPFSVYAFETRCLSNQFNALLFRNFAF